MKYILALNDENDTSAALYRGNSLVALGEEERFNRQKHTDEFPLQSVEYVLEEEDISLSDVDSLVLSWDCNKYPVEMAEKYLDITYQYDVDEETLNWSKKQLREYRPEKVREYMRTELEKLDGDVPEIQFVDHHKSHAVSAFYYSGFESSAILTADGYGEENTVTAWMADGDGMEKVFSFELPNSLGWFMYSVTTFLGFRADRDEGKVMGLASYGEPTPEIRDILENILTVTSDGFEVDPTYIFYGEHSYHERFTDKLVDELGEPREHGEELTSFHENVAYEGQKLLEEALLSCGERVLKETGADKICLAGGVALNCKANMRLREQLDIEDIFVQPVAGDNGTPLGAGLLAADTTSYASDEQMKNPYWGYEASHQQVKEAIHAQSVEIIESEKRAVQKKIAEKIADGNVVGRYTGRMECGPRALGNRSILADPSDEQNLINVNKVKNREEWRPFAPTILAESAGEILEGSILDRFMIQTYDVKPEQSGQIEATVHVDGTTRPQVLTKDMNEGYWELIREFYEATGVPAVLNTSFNLSGDPIVRTPEEAIETFLSSQIDYLQLNQYLLGE